MNWQQRWSDRPKLPAQIPDVHRITSLPVTAPITPEQIEELSLQNVQAKHYDQGFRLLSDQAAGLHSFLQNDHGPFASIRVGGGKTGLCQLIASHHFQRNPGSKILLLIPASVYSQFWMRDLPWGRQHLALSVPFIGMGNLARKKRRAFAHSGRAGCYILPYSCLSTEDTIEVLRAIDADLVIADEAQNLKGDSAKTKRFWGFVNKRKITPRGVCMSGTLTAREPMDYYKLIRWSLGPNSPLPKLKVQAAEWSNLLRSGAPNPTRKERECVRPLIQWAGQYLPKVSGTTEGIRKAYHHRLRTVPGSVASEDKALGVGLEIANVSAKPPGENLTKMLRDVERDWVSPNGDLLSFGIELHNTLRELSAGFYYRRYWPEDHPLVARAKAHHQAGQEYYKELQQFFQSTILPREGMDTPMAVGKYHFDNGPIKSWGLLYQLWTDWKALFSDDLPERLSEPIWVDEYKIAHALDWASNIKTGGIIWCHHRAVAAKLVKELSAAGFNTLLKGAGDDWLHNDGSEESFCVASISAHGTGKNLQHHRHQLLVQWPRPAVKAEQLLGRTHRTGQQADRLVVHTNHTLDWDHEQMACTIADTVYSAETLGGRRKLLIADWNPLPRTYPREFLRARGM